MTITEYSRARIARDRNFDGKFVFGVKTTGIFCKPSCPSPPAKEENVVYFESIFQALQEGFRPCLRCRPDITMEYGSGSPGSYTVVNAALSMIYDGFLNYHSLNDLAAEFNISDRHLRQLFIDRLGVPPVKIARYHKALFARKLLLHSESPITEIALASGFGSIRQFNSVFKEIFSKTPTEMRKEDGPRMGQGEETALLLKYDQPFHFGQIISFMKDRALKGVELVTDTSYSRTFRTSEAEGWFVVTDNPDQSALELRIFCDDIKCYMEIYNRVRRIFDLDTDFRVIKAHFDGDKRLQKGMENGQVPRLPRAFNPFEFVVRAVLGQQISIKAATTIASRIVHKASIKSPDDYPRGLDYFFPTAEELAAVPIDDAGLPHNRQQTVKTVIAAVLDGRISLSSQQSLDDFNRDFSALKGIGDWTVNYVAMRGLGLSDCFPADDLAVIKALSSGEKRVSKKEILKLAEKWRPYRSYATLCLWNSLKE